MQDVQDKNIWDMLRLIEAAIEVGRANSAVVVILVELLANPDWDLMATRLLPVGVARDNFNALNLSIIAKGGNIIMENAIHCAKQIRNLSDRTIYQRADGATWIKINEKQHVKVAKKVKDGKVLELSKYLIPTKKL